MLDINQIDVHETITQMDASDLRVVRYKYKNPQIDASEHIGVLGADVLPKLVLELRKKTQKIEPHCERLAASGTRFNGLDIIDRMLPVREGETYNLLEAGLDPLLKRANELDVRGTLSVLISAVKILHEKIESK